MAAKASLAPGCVSARGATPIHAARSALRAVALPPRRLTMVRASPDDAASAGSGDEPKRERKKDGFTAAGEGLENADDWIANWKRIAGGRCAFAVGGGHGSSRRLAVRP